MIPLGIAEVAELCPGRLDVEPWAEEITGVQSDSRRICEGDLFVVVGAGADFLRHALARGAAATLVPDDAHASLAALGRAVRERSRARVVGITGSTGKTSTKDILAAICAPQLRTIAAQASYNNELGLPLTLCRLEPDSELCILELAMRGLGQIAKLCEIGRPDMGVVTNVGPAHLELVGSLEGVVRAKTELIEALPPGGVAVVPEDFPVARTDLGVVRFGEADAVIEDGRMLIQFEGREIEFSFDALHQAGNALVALLAARAIGVEADSPVEVAFARWRGEELALPGGGLLVNDSWNANPVSMRAALEHLARRAAGRRCVAILGGMAELGPDWARYHEEIAALAARLGIEVLAVGELARAYGFSDWVADPAAATERARAMIRPGDCVLVKGSRAVGLETVADALTPVAA